MSNPSSPASATPAHHHPRLLARLGELGLTLPQAPAPVAAYVPAKQIGNIIHVSGQLPFAGGELIAKGIVPTQVSADAAARAAGVCGLNAIAAAVAILDDPDRLVGVARVGCFVAATPEFTDHPKIANGCSTLFQDVFGEAGRHARAAVGVASLPLGASVEIEVSFIVE